MEQWNQAAQGFFQNAHWSGRRELVDADIGAGDAAIDWQVAAGRSVALTALGVGPFGQLSVLGSALVQDATVTVQGRNADGDDWVDAAVAVNCVAGTPTVVFDGAFRWAQVQFLQRETTLAGGSLAVSFCFKA